MLGDVTWSTPGQSSADSLPIGNGDIAANVWTEPNGDIALYLAKNDAWDGLGRLIKIGRLRLRISPSLMAGGKFKQRLELADAAVMVTNEATTVRLWVDAHWPRLVIEVQSEVPCTLEASLDRWRNEARIIAPNEVHAVTGMDGGPVPLVAQPDHVIEDAADSVIWYQRNESSIWQFTLDQQGLGEFKVQSADPLLHRTFGGHLSGTGFKRHDGRTLRSIAPMKSAFLSVTVHTAQTATPTEWVNQIRAHADAVLPSSAERWRDHQQWWHEFWDRSYVRIESTAPDWDQAANVTRHAAWQRYLVACCSRGMYPLKFNGGLFTADWGLKDEPFDADYRRWGGGYWWQNTRLPYWATLASGDHEFLRPLFRMYREMLPLATLRTRTWFKHDGVFFPETLYFWGTNLPSNYGWDRGNRAVSEVSNPYIGRLYVGGLELTALMLETYAHTLDRALVEEELLPIADGVLKFYAQHYPVDETGRLRLRPAQSLETWWEVENPLPDVAGLHYVLPRLLALPPDLLKAGVASAWRDLLGRLPKLPETVIDGQAALLPAEKHEPVPHNSENAELYSVFPFKLHGVGRAALETARWTFAQRRFPDTGGWRQDALMAALLGLTENAAYFVAKNFGAVNPNARFPGFWGPNYDWVPDFDHGSVTQLALQAMLVQTVGEKIYLFPAWPAEQWNVSFKSHLPGQTSIECELKHGEIARLTVHPAERQKDVVVLLGKNKAALA